MWRRVWWPLFGQTPRRWIRFSRGDIPSLALAFAYWCWICMKLILERFQSSTRIGMFMSLQKLRDMLHVRKLLLVMCN